VFFGEDVGYIGVASYVQDIDNAGLLGILDRYLAKVKVSQFLWDGAAWRPVNRTPVVI
jgi:hypothetical protein